MKEYIALAIFAIVYVLIVGRIRFKVPIWIAMSIGAVLMVSLQVIDVESAAKSIRVDVIVFLFAMFSIISALDRSGLLKLVAAKMMSKAKTPELLLMAIVVGMGLLSAFLVNDTLALMGIPLIIYISRRVGARPVVLLIALAFGITVGSAMTPIGNPQNLLIALQSGISLPFTSFLKFLAVPTVVNLFLTWYVLKIYFKKDLQQMSHNYEDNTMISSVKIENPRLAKISLAVLLATIAGFFVSEVLRFLHVIDIDISIVALIGAAVIYAASGQRYDILKSVNYTVLVFFAAMFVVTGALWSSGTISLFMKYLPIPNPHDLAQSSAVISAYSITLGQILSNVPFVALYNHVMIANGFTGAHVAQWMMLAASSTISGNLTILGAASSIIIIQAAESKGVKAFTFFEFFKIGILVTAVNLAVYYVFIVSLGMLS
ncbi:MAG: anion permease [Thaumarchaeota archaeon]|nr:anion permease [Nitrososphaerota archaeon]MDE1878200.1 anion permease [Nitrososphaerota archaeon]